MDTLDNVNSRKQHPLYSVARIAVPCDKVKWDVPYDMYIDMRPYYMHDAVKNNLKLPKDDLKRWAESDIGITESDYLKQRVTYIRGFKQTLEEAGIEFDENNLPVNPIGRTGMYGPGLLGKNGPNQTADPIFTRWAPFTVKPLIQAIKNIRSLFTFSITCAHIFVVFGTILKELLLLIPHLQMIAIQRSDTKDWAIPGGMVEAGQTVSQTLRNEINEEACNNMDPKNASKEIDVIFEKNTNDDGSIGNIVYRGYVDDPRNTDSRWLETTAVHFHCSGKLAKAIKLEAGDDAKKVAWVNMTSLDSRYRNLYANHKMMTDKVIEKYIFRF